MWQLKQKGHENFEFIDVTVNDDNLFKAYNTCNRQDMRCLLSHAGEQNATRLGYGNGDNGKGNTADGLLEIFQPLGI